MPMRDWEGAAERTPSGGGQAMGAAPQGSYAGPGGAGQARDERRIAEAAYSRWQRQSGDPESNWLAAERELAERAHDSGGRVLDERAGAQGQVPRAAADVVYTCPMHPEVRQSSPGKCPKCGMALVRK